MAELLLEEDPEGVSSILFFYSYFAGNADQFFGEMTVHE